MNWAKKPSGKLEEEDLFSESTGLVYLSLTDFVESGKWRWVGIVYWLLCGWRYTFFFSHEHQLPVSSPSLLTSSSFSWSRLRVPSDANVVERSRQAATIAFEVYIMYSEHSGHSMCMSWQRFIVDVVRSSHSTKQWFIIGRALNVLAGHQCALRKLLKGAS